MADDYDRLMRDVSTATAASEQAWAAARAAQKCKVDAERALVDWLAEQRAASPAGDRSTEGSDGE